MVPDTVAETRWPSSNWRMLWPTAAALFIALGLLAVIWLFARALAVLALAITIADALSPIVRWLQRWMNRTLATAAVYIVLLGLFALILLFLIPRLSYEVQTLMAQAPQIEQSLSDKLSSVTHSLPLGDLGGRTGGQIAGWAVKVPVGIGEGLVTAALIFFLSFYWLVAMPGIHEFLRTLFPERLRTEVDKTLAAISRSMGGYLRGVALNGIVVGSLAAIGLYFLGVNFPFALGVIAALGEFVPYLGPIAASIPAILIALLQSPEKALFVIGLYLAIGQIEGHVLTPNIMRSQTNLSQVLVIIALFAGGDLGFMRGGFSAGVLGAIVAVPIAGLFKALIETVVVPLIRSHYADQRKKQELDAA